MTIRSHDETGFVVYTTKDGQLVGELRIDYAQLAENVSRAAIRNGISQWLGDCGAGKSLEDHKKAFAAKAERFLAGIAPRDSRGRGVVDEFTSNLFDVIVTYLRKRGQKAKEAEALAEDPETTAQLIGEELAKSPKAKKSAAEYAEAILAGWRAEAQRRIDADKLPGVDDED